MRMKLSDFCEINPRVTLKKGQLAKKIAMTDLPIFGKSINSYTIERYNGGTKFQNGDTLMARITPCLENGKGGYVDILDEGEVGFGSTEYIVFRGKLGVSDSQFLYYFINTHEFREIAIKSMTGTSGRQRVQTDLIANMEFDFPELDEQRKIATILCYIDEKIKVNNKLNANLEEQISVLFNKYYENAENEVTLSECCSLTSSKRVFAKDYVQEGIPFYRGKEITLKRNGQQISDLLYISEEHYETIKSKYGVPMEGDILITAVGTLGNSYLVQQEKFYFKDGNVIWLKDFNNSEENYYIYDYMQSRMFRNAIDSIRIGSTQAALTIVSLGKLKVIVPNKAKLKEYYNISKAIRNKINTNIKETEKLIEIRNTLLPILMSGSINLSDI